MLITVSARFRAPIVNIHHRYGALRAPIVNIHHRFGALSRADRKYSSPFRRASRADRKTFITIYRLGSIAARLGLGSV